MKEIYISVDIEASGPIPGKYSMLSLGACVVGRAEETFYIEIEPISSTFVPEAMSVIGKSLDYYYQSGVKPQESMRNFAEWIKQVSKDAIPVFVGFNAPFDWSFVNWYFHNFVGENPFGIGGLDIKSYYAGISGCDWEDTRSSRIPDKYGFDRRFGHQDPPDRKMWERKMASLIFLSHIFLSGGRNNDQSHKYKGASKHTHHALDDAIEQAKMFELMRQEHADIKAMI